MKSRKLKKINIAIPDKKTFMFLMILNSFDDILNVGIGLLYGNLINLVSQNKAFSQLSMPIALTATYVLFKSFLSWYCQYMNSKFAIKSKYLLKNNYIQKLFATKYSIMTKEDSSRYINNLTNDIDRVVNVYSLHLVYLVASCVAVVTSFFASLTLNWKITASMMGFVSLLAIMPLIIKKPLDKSIVKISEKNKQYIASLKENLLGIAVIRSNNAEEVCQEDIFKENLNLLKAQKKHIIINSFAGGIGNIIATIAILCLIIITCYFVSTGEVLVGAVFSIYSIGSLFYSNILGCSWIVTNIFSMKGTREIIQEVIDYPDVSKGGDIVLNDGVFFNNVTFGYPNMDSKVLKNFNFKFIKNKKYLIIGKSGSGKSTILKLMCKFYDQYEGTVSFDDNNYELLSEGQVNKVIAYAQQDCYLFNRSLEENIDFKKTGNKERLNEILNKVGLSDFVEHLPNGTDTVINEEVNQVSGGERLRINLARALFREGEILLLDEVTSALDKRTSEIVERNIMSINDRTVVNVCHKFNDKVLPMYDEIIVIEDGKIALSGKFEEIKDDPILKNYRNMGEVSE